MLFSCRQPETQPAVNQQERETVEELTQEEQAALLDLAELNKRWPNSLRVSIPPGSNLIVTRKRKDNQYLSDIVLDVENRMHRP